MFTVLNTTEQGAVAPPAIVPAFLPEQLLDYGNEKYLDVNRGSRNGGDDGDHDFMIQFSSPFDQEPFSTSTFVRSLHLCGNGPSLFPL
jgi:hypothetical protein